MRFDTNRRATDTSPEHEQERERRQSLPYLIDRLGEIAPDIPDDELRTQIHRWLGVATRMPTDDSEFVENKLEELNSEYPMYRKRGMDNHECFPEDCLSNCDHAEQQACPMLTDYDVLRRRRRIRSGQPSPDEYRTDMKALAGDVGCHVVSDAVRVVEEHLHPIKRYGKLLLAQAQEEIAHADQSDAIAQELASIDLGELAEGADLDLPDPTAEADDPVEMDASVVDVGEPTDGDGDGDDADTPEVGVP